jgi:hypothetical protein
MSKQTALNSIEDVFKLFGSNVAMADILRVTPSGVSEMKRRKSIPVEYWQPIVKEAKKMARDDLTLEKMAVLSAKAARAKAKAREVTA